MLKRILFISFVYTSCAINGAFGQSDNSKKSEFSEKNVFYFYWGYNRSAYTKSNLTCIGPGYNFTMNGLKASDNPERFNPKVYFNPKKITIPQFNVRMGYYFGDHWGVSIGYDHMKYVMDNHQTVNLTGYIDEELGAKWAGNYQNEAVTTNTKFIHYENSDGLNYMRVSAIRIDNLLTYGKNDWFRLDWQIGFSGGFMLPFNDFNFAGQYDRRTISISGLGLSVHPSVRAVFLNHLFLQFELGSGYIDQMHVQTRPDDKQSYAFQKFGYISTDFVFGYKWRFKRRSKN